MIRLFSPEAFRDYIAGEPITTNDFTNNGTVVLQPKECYLEIEAINDSWQLTLKHDYDEEGRYTYIQKGCVIEAPCKVAREQTSENQLFRIFEVRDSFGVLEALAYPIAMESTYETPIYYHEWKKVTPKQLAESLSLINPKYKVETDIVYRNDVDPLIAEINARLVQLEQGGNVNLLKRPEIPSSLLVAAGWTDAGSEGIATVYSSTYCNQQETKFYNFTPIIDDPKTGKFIKVISPNQLTSYAEDVIDGRRQDTLNAQIGGPFDSAEEAEAAAIEIHELHEELSELRKVPDIAKSIIASQTSLHGVLLGDSDYTFTGMFSSEVVYDNFTYIINKTIGKKNAKANKYFYAVNIAGIEVTENTTDLITRIYPMSSEGLRYEETINNETHTFIDAENIERYPIVYARVVKYDSIKTFEEKDSSAKVPQTPLQKLTQQCKAAVKSRVRTLSMEYLKNAHKGKWDHSKLEKSHFVDDGNMNYLKFFSWLYDGKGYYYGDGKGHYMKNAWVEDSPNKHYWVNGDGYWDPGYDDTTETWEWHGNDNDGWWYGVEGPSGNSVYCQHQWMKIGKTWYWFNQSGYWVKDTNGGDPDKTLYYTNPHDTSFAIKEYNLRWALPYGYLFYSYTDAIEYLKDQALLGITMEYDSLEERQDATTNAHELSPSELLAAKEDVWNLFADAIQQGFKWCENTDIAEWDWREWSTATQDPEKNYLKDYTWHKEYVDANNKIVPKSKSVATKWWYGYLETKDEEKIYHCIKSGWVEESHTKHYWCDADGWWNPQYDDTSEWAWQVTDAGKDWYGSKTISANWANQWIYDSQAGKWYFLNPEGYWYQDEVRWMFGTRDLSDGIVFAWKKVGNTYWWFDREGCLDPTLAYCESFAWQTDENNEKKHYYGDEDGHILKNCWVEDSTGVHKLLDADGYWYEENEDDSSSDSEDADDNTNEEETSDESEDESSDDDTSSKDDRTNVTYDNENWSWHSSTYTDTSGNEVTRYWYGRYYQDSKGVEDTNRKQYWAKDQWMYVTENKAWYRFDENGWCTAAWVSTNTWEWHKDDTGWWYGDGQGGKSTYFAGQWAKIDSKWYYFDHNGYADKYTDDYESSKTESNGSATLETNRDGITASNDKSTVGSATTTAAYNEKREGVQAWIQQGFIDSIRNCVDAQYTKLKNELNKQLRTAAEKTLKAYSYPTLTIEVDLALMKKMEGYEAYEYLGDMYLGDWVSILYPARGMYDNNEYETSGKYVALDERIVGMTYDCVNECISNLTIGSPKNVIYKRTGALTAKTGIIVEGNDTDVLETGYEGGTDSKYLEVSRRIQYIEG